MRYKHFKNADVKVSCLAVGTWAIGGKNYGPVDREGSIRAIRRMEMCIRDRPDCLHEFERQAFRYLL